MKKILLFSAFILVNAMAVSCTADEVAGVKSASETETQADGGIGGQGGSIPIPPPPPPKPPIG